MVSLSRCSLLLAIALQLFASEAIHIVTNNATKQTEYVLLDRRSIALPNVYRNKTSFKFSLNGAHITRLHTKSTTAWKMEMDDHSVIHFVKKEGASTGQMANNRLVTEYYFRWIGGSEKREVCFHYGHNNASWYNTYQSLAAHWPMDTSRLAARRHFNYLLDFDYDSSRDEHLLILEHLFLNSDGFALMLDSSSPLFIRRDPNYGDPQLCISVGNSYPYLSTNHDPEYRDIKFRLFSGKNIKAIYGIVANQFGLIAKPVAPPSELLFRAPIWTTWNQFNGNLNQSNVLRYAEEVTLHGFPNSTIELHRKWEQHYGDLAFDETHFPNPQQMIDRLHHQGHAVNLWVYPNIHTDSPLYESSKRYFITDNTKRPIVINYSDGMGSYIDFSNHDAAEWYVERLKRFKEAYHIDGYHFNEAVLYDFNSLNVERQVQKYPSLLTKHYAECAYKLASNEVVLDSAFKTQYLPNFVNINAKSSDWSAQNGLQSLIPTVLALSIAGYSFIVPGIIGGGYSVSQPSEELYIRWVQATALMTAMKFSVPPWKYGHSVVNLTRTFVDLHAQYAPLLLELAQRRVQDGTPILRPMWFVAPDDPRTYRIDDQFMVGSDLLVAPVLTEKARQRQVYFPLGQWTDQHGKVFSGPAVSTVSAPLNELPYFRRVTQ